MPTKIDFTVDDYFFVKSELEKMGYSIKTGWEFKGDYSRLGLIAPRSKPGREATFVLSANNLNSIVHVTFDVVHMKWREEDLGWSLITKGDIEQYFSKPLRRTKNFILQFLRRAWINKWRVKYRPNCRVCKKRMEIREKYKLDPETKERKPTGQYYWGCFETEKHPDGKPVFLGWDKIGPLGKLPPKAEEFVDMMRNRVAAYKKRNKALGIERTPARKIRNKWGIKNKDNLIKPK